MKIYKKWDDLGTGENLIGAKFRGIYEAYAPNYPINCMFCNQIHREYPSYSFLVEYRIALDRFLSDSFYRDWFTRGICYKCLGDPTRIILVNLICDIYFKDMNNIEPKYDMRYKSRL